MKDQLNKNLKDAIKKVYPDQEPQQFVDDLKETLIRNPKDTRAVSQLQDLTSLIVLTYNQQTILKSGMLEFVNTFFEESNPNLGNGKRFIKSFILKANDFDPNKFIPTQTDPEKFKVQFIKFKNEQTGALMPNSEQKLWSITYRTSDLITYLINGQLTEFIENQVIGYLSHSMTVHLYDRVMKAIVNTNGKGKHTAGTATNLFDCLTLEVFPDLKLMLQNTKDFNYDQTLTEAMDASKKEDLVLVCSPKVKVMLESHIMSQLFNQSKIDLKNYVGQIHVPNNEFDFAGDTVTTKATNYISDDKIIVFDRTNYLKFLTFLEQGGSQEFPLNLTHLDVEHLWSTYDYLGWGKVYTYTNANLTTSPANPIP